MRTISKKAIDLIIEFEVSSKEAYEKKYNKPIWPGVQSGVTIGIGYDLGYVTPAQFRHDWAGYLPDFKLDELEKVVGLKGQAAKDVLNTLNVRVSWEAAYAVFSKVSMPAWIRTVERALSNTDKLSPDSLGAIVSLAYNRGPSFGIQGERYKEMRAIKAHMVAGEYSKIPAELRAMKRIWPTVKGLQVRREREAVLFTQGLAQPLMTPQVAAATAVILGTSAAITQTPFQYIPYVLGGGLLAGILLGLGIWLIRRK